MALTKKQVKQLRALAHHLQPALIIGKYGVTEAAITQADDQIDRLELMKCTVLEACPLEPAEVGDALARGIDAEVVQVIGNRVILYRRTRRDDVTPIALVKD